MRPSRADEPELLEEVGDDVLRAAAHDEADLRLLRSVGYRSMIIVPLSARGRTLGALSLAVTERSGRRFVPEDLRFVEVLAGRVALALDNAGLFIELQTMEAQLTAVLGSLTEAVTVRGARGGLIYANQAAADLLGFDSPQALLATPAREIARALRLLREDGRPLDLADVPGARLLAGESPEPLVMRVVHRETGEQAWRLIKCLGRARQRRRDHDGGQRHRRRHGEQARRAGPAAARRGRRGAGLLDGRAPARGRAVRSRARGLVRDQRARTIETACRPRPSPLHTRSGPSSCCPPPSASWTRPRHSSFTTRSSSRACAPRSSSRCARSSARPACSASSTRSPGGAFRDEDVTLAMELARRTATGLENQRLYAERSSIARILQASLLPEQLPELPGWQAASLYRPAGDENWVGGDFYQAFPVGPDWMLVVGDVTGRGAPAAALTALMRHTLRTAATLSGSAVQALEKLNRDLVARPEVSLCTAVCLVLRELEDRAEADIICAGHPLPVLVRDGVAQHAGRFGPMLGAFENEDWEAHTLPVRPRDVLVLYSDGVLDAVGAEDRFGPDRLLETLTGATGAADAVARIERELARFEVGAQADDTAILAVERIGDRAALRPGPGRPGEPAGR